MRNPHPRRNYVAEIMAEIVVYGGLIATRGEVYLDALECTGDWLAADRFAMKARPATADDIAFRWTLKAMREHEAKSTAGAA